MQLICASKKSWRITLLTDLASEDRWHFFEKYGFHRSDTVPMRLYRVQQRAEPLFAPHSIACTTRLSDSPQQLMLACLKGERGLPEVAWAEGKKSG